MKTPTPRAPRKTSSAVKAAPAASPKTTTRARRAAPRKTRAVAAADAALAVTTDSPSPDLEAVRFRAYEIYLTRNGEGDALSDWLQAEHELFARAG